MVRTVMLASDPAPAATDAGSDHNAPTKEAAHG